MDMVLCKQVSHHIPEERLDDLFSEIWRVLRPNGQFLFMDSMKNDRRVSNVLWRYDRGAYPRPEADLRLHLDRHFELLHREAHWHLHQYVLLLLAPIPSSEMVATPTGGAIAVGVGEIQTTQGEAAGLS